MVFDSHYTSVNGSGYTIHKSIITEEKIYGESLYFIEYCGIFVVTILFSGIFRKAEVHIGAYNIWSRSKCIRIYPIHPNV